MSSSQPEAMNGHTSWTCWSIVEYPPLSFSCAQQGIPPPLRQGQCHHSAQPGVHFQSIAWQDHGIRPWSADLQHRISSLADHRCEDQQQLYPCYWMWVEICRNHGWHLLALRCEFTKDERIRHHVVNCMTGVEILMHDNVRSRSVTDSLPISKVI